MTDDEIQQVVDALVQGFSDPGSKSVPMATTDADEVIRSQLTENTGRHLLDSGGAYGRNWEENQENPPWEQPAYEVYDGFVVRNVYHHMSQRLDRDRTALDLEMALYAFGYSDEYARESWLNTMKAFTEMLHEPVYHEEIRDQFDLPVPVADSVAGYAADLERTDRRAFSFNSYNSEFGDISQVLQGVALGPAYAPHSEYVLLQVHGGADVRGGYTAPRVYKAAAADAMTSEFFASCERCGWQDAESCLYGSDELLYVDGIADGFLLDEHDWLDERSLEAADAADHIDGAVFHRECGGHVVHR